MKKEACSLLFLLHNETLLLQPSFKMEREMKKKKPCQYCLKVRWLVLYLGCFALLGILFANQFLEKGL